MEGVSRFQVFLAIKRSGLYVALTALVGGGQKDEIGRKKFLILYFDNISD